jgi:hypothetical protein
MPADHYDCRDSSTDTRSWYLGGTYPFYECVGSAGAGCRQKRFGLETEAGTRALLVVVEKSLVDPTDAAVYLPVPSDGHASSQRVVAR